MSKSIKNKVVSLIALTILTVTLLINASISLSLSQATQQAPTTVNKQIPATTAREITSCTVIDSPGVYVLTQDIAGTYPGEEWCIKINASNVVLDGQGHSITGIGQVNQTQVSMGMSIFIECVSNVTIRNIKITQYLGGVFITTSNNVKIENSEIINNYLGIGIAYSPHSAVTNNTIVGGEVELPPEASFYKSGVLLFDSNNSYIVGNKFINSGLSIWRSYDNVVENNLVNGKPLIYLEKAENVTIDYLVGQVIAVRSVNITVTNIVIENTSVGITFIDTFYSKIENTVIANNHFEGIHLERSFNNSIINNIIANNHIGIGLWDSHYNEITDNIIVNNTYFGIMWLNSGGNYIYNNFFNNTANVVNETEGWQDWNTTLAPGRNIVGGNWIGGNYWATPNGTGYSQVCRDVEEPIGICDQPYVINRYNIDYSPLAGPVLIPVPTIITTTTQATTTTTLPTVTTTKTPTNNETFTWILTTTLPTTPTVTSTSTSISTAAEKPTSTAHPAVSDYTTWIVAGGVLALIAVGLLIVLLKRK